MKLMLQNASAVKSGREPFFRLTSRNILKTKKLHLCNRLMVNERRQYIRKQIHESEKNPNKL